MDLTGFRLAWRWTALPAEVRETITPLEPEVARAVYELTPGPNHVVPESRHDSGESPERTRAWLRELGWAHGDLALVAWDETTAVSVPWPAFIEHWDAFCYPSSDDVVIRPNSLPGLLLWDHEEVFSVHPTAASPITLARAAAMTEAPRLFCDFNGGLGDGTFPLTFTGTLMDLEALGIRLEPGMKVVLYDHDTFDDGSPAWLVRDAVLVESRRRGLAALPEGDFRWEPRSREEDEQVGLTFLEARLDRNRVPRFSEGA